MAYRTIAVLVGIVLVLGLVGRLDMEAEEADRAHYCEMVKAHLWPDFKGTYRKECKR